MYKGIFSAIFPSASHRNFDRVFILAENGLKADAGAYYRALTTSMWFFQMQDKVTRLISNVLPFLDT